MSKPRLEPAAPYENLHLVARDYLERIRDHLSEMQQPDDPNLSWSHVDVMAKVTANLAQVADALDTITMNRT